MRGDRITLAGRDQGQVAPLRPPRPGALAAGAPAQVVGQRRSGPHRIDAGLLPRRLDQRRAIAGGEHVGIVQHLQGWTSRQEAVLVERKSGLGKPRRRRRMRGNEDRVGIETSPVREQDRVRFERGDAFSLVKRNRAFSEDATECRADGRVVGRQDVVAGHKREREASAVATIGAGIGQQPRAQRQYEFYPAGPAAHDRDPTRTVGAAAALAQMLELGEETRDRLDGDAMIRRAADRSQIRRDADIDRDEIVRHRGVIAQEHLFGGAVEPDRLGMEQPRAGGRGQADEIDMGLLARVEAGDDARQHARIGRGEIARDQAHPHPRHGPHGERGEHMHMGMAAADQHDIGPHSGAAIHLRPTNLLPTPAKA